MKRDAEITVGADATAVQRAMAVSKAAVRDFSQSATSAFGEAARALVTGLADVALAQGKINLASQHAQVRDFEASTAHMGIAAGRDLEAVRAATERTGIEIGKRPGEVIAWSQEVGRLTYSYMGAADSVKAYANLAALTGRQVDDYRHLATELGQIGITGKDAANTIGIMVAQADDLKVTGGPAALIDQFENLGDVVTHFADRSTEGIARVTGAMAALGRGLDTASAGRVTQQAFGAVTADPLRWERFLRHGITDEHGHVEHPEQVLREITEKVRSRYGKDARRVLMLNFGAETGAALYNADWSAAARSAGLAPSGAPAAAQAALLATDAGKRAVAEAELAQSSRALLGSSTLLGRAADAMQQFAAHNPLTSTLVSSALGGGLASFLGRYGTTLATMMGGKGGGGAIGGIADLATKGAPGWAKAIPVIGAGVAGFAAGAELGDYLEKNYGDEIDAATGDIFGINQSKAQMKLLDEDIARQKKIRDQKRAERAFAGLRGKADAAGTPLTLLRPGTEAATAPGPWAPVTTEEAPGTAGAPATMPLAGHAPGTPHAAPPVDTRGIERAVEAGFKGAKITIVNATGGPIEVAEQARQSSAAGNQSHG